MANKSLLTSVRWGEKSIIALYISVFSGVVVALQYNVSEPFYSISNIELLSPFGAFWRGLHYYASQLFFLFSIMHLLVIVWEGKHRQLPAYRWILLVGALAVSLLLLFTGYVLRGDATGYSAGVIAENITVSLPLLGTWLNELLFAISTEALKRVYAHHLIGLMALWLFMSWDHLRRYRVQICQHPWLLSLLVGFSFLFPAPLEPERLGMLHITGPWFFLGLQELLRHIQPLWAGVVFPATFLAGLCLMSQGGRLGRGASVYVVGWLGLYLLLTMVSVSRFYF